MKHFFFPYDGNACKSGVLNGLFEKYDKNSDDSDLLKIFYDAADIIYDKRLEKEDKELGELVGDQSGALPAKVRQFYNLLRQYQSNGEGDEKYRIRALKMLWNYIEEEYKIFDRKYGGKLFDDFYQSNGWNRETAMGRTLYYLVKGNICMRISQCYYDYYDLKNSDFWGDHAIEFFWHGKQLAAEWRNVADGEESRQADLYLRLIKLNLAKHFRDYARRNRRSDFDAALDEFKHVRRRVEEEMPRVDDPAMKRQYALIWMDAVLNVIIIRRKRYQPKIIKQDLQFLYICMKERFMCDQTDHVYLELIGKVDKLILEPDAARELKWELKDLPGLTVSSFERYDDLTDYDRKRYFLLVLLELSRNCRDLHCAENYSKAIAIGTVANGWSAQMDKREDYTPGPNIDAYVTISSSIRKYIKYAADIGDARKFSGQIKFDINGTPYSLDKFERDRERKIGETLSGLIKELNTAGENGHLKSQAEVIKWYCLCLQKPEGLEINKDAIESYKIIKDMKKENGTDQQNANVQLRFLRGLVCLRRGKYREAITVLEELVAPDNQETQYIRFGTIGLKARYLLAVCYMTLTEYSKAEKLLHMLIEILTAAKTNRNKNSIDRERDTRIEIDLGYCYMQRREYKRAIKIYENLFGIKRKLDGFETKCPTMDPSREIMGLNNYAACCIFSIDDQDENLTVDQKKAIIQKIFSRLDEIFLQPDMAVDSQAKVIDPETSLLKGYYALCEKNMPPLEVIKKMEENKCNDSAGQGMDLDWILPYVKAHQHFREACRFDRAFSPQYNMLNENEAEIGNKAKYRDEVERISAYIINLTKLYWIHSKYYEPWLISKCETEQIKYLEESRRNLERLILGFPTRYKISLKAAIALAEWLLEYNGKGGDLKNQLMRSFSYVTLYEERGARVFNALKDNANFRFFTAAQRGELLAYLLAMYKPIKAIKEECCFNLNSKKTGKENELKLVHYTSIDSLKKMLAEKTLEQEADDKHFDTAERKQKCTSHFRINNCGYMNDVFEGKTFLKGIDLISRQIVSIKDPENLELVKTYFPQINRSHENMLPSGSNVYIGSLSVKEDSFPMWKVYAKNEKGCNIEFGEGFFDIDGVPYSPQNLRDYLISKYTDEDYPLYVVQYIDAKFEDECEKYLKENAGQEKFAPFYTGSRNQVCGTEAIGYRSLCGYLHQIFVHWEKLEKYLNKLSKDAVSDSISSVRAFTADRINEVRFLFKDADYEFEGEVRIIYTDSEDHSNAKVDSTIKVPRVYVDINRKLEDLTIRLGSRIEDATVDQYVTWLKHTKVVKQIELAKRNRYTS